MTEQKPTAEQIDDRTWKGKAKGIGLMTEPPDLGRQHITIPKLRRLGFGEFGMNGCSVLIDGGAGDPVELFMEPQPKGEWVATLVQSNSQDMVVITGRKFRTIQELSYLLSSLGWTAPLQRVRI